VADIILPDGTRIGDQAFAPPSVDAQFLAQGLQLILNALNGVQMQLDALIRMESNETSRSEIKSRVRRADEVALERRLKAEAEAGTRAEEMEARDAEAKQVIAEREARLASEADDEMATVHDIGGEG